MKYCSWEVLIEDKRVKVIRRLEDVTLECFPTFKANSGVHIPMGCKVPEKVRNSVIYNMNRLKRVM